MTEFQREVGIVAAFLVFALGYYCCAGTVHTVVAAIFN